MVIRDVELVSVAGASFLEIIVSGGGFILPLCATAAVSGLYTGQWQGRAVVPEGETVEFFSGPEETIFYISGYVLT